MHALWRDLKYATRRLRRSPGFALVVVLTLGLGVGANAAIFSLLDQVLIRKLPVRQPSELVLLDGPGPFQGRTFNEMTFSYPMYQDFRDRNEVFSGVLARFPMEMAIVWRGQSERVQGELVSGNYFEVLGVSPAIGRLFKASDDHTPGAHPLAILSYGYWQRKFGGDPSVIGQTLVVNGHPMTIVGVSQPGFAGLQMGRSADVLVPIMMKAQMTPTWNDLDNRRSRWLTIIGRRRPGITMTQVESQMNVLYRQINEQEIKDYTNVSDAFRGRFVAKRLNVLDGSRGLSDLRRQFSTPLVVLMCMVAVVLLIACVNVANLLLARATSRQREIALRLALGANRSRIVSEQFVESVVLATAGAAMGLVLATWTGGVLLTAIPGDATTSTLSSAPDLRVIGFTLTLSILTALACGIAPAMSATRSSVTLALKDDAGSVAGGGRQARLRRVLVITQVAMSMLLLAGAGLFARSLYNLRTVNPGFQTDSLLTFNLNPALNGYSPERSLALFERIQQELAAIPGVRDVSVSEVGVLTGDQWGMTVKVEGYTRKEDEDMNPSVDGVGPRYFATMGIPLVAGREFTAKDTLGAPRVAIINQTMAHYFYGDANPIGRRIGFGRDPGTPIEIVGVVKDVRALQLRDRPVRYVYLPYGQDESLTSLIYYVRSAGVSSIGTSVRQAVQRIDPNLPIANMKTMEVQIGESLYVERLVAVLSVAFGGLATLLAAIGLYGVMSYAVARRTREIGIRMALGAERAGVLWLVQREVALMAAIGIAAGLGLALYLTRRVESQFFGLSPTDPATFAVAIVFLFVVALMAGFVPARRAIAIDPNLALRSE